MCRVVAYLGSPLPLEDLLFLSDSSLVRQTHSPRMVPHLNLAGFGMAAWVPGTSRPEEPLVYRSTVLPPFDPNLRGLAGKLKVTAVVAHVRGVPFNDRDTVGEQNLHPFHQPVSRWVLAHNGDLHRFARMRFSLVEHLAPEHAEGIRGNTDSEWVHALFLSRWGEAGGTDLERVGTAVRETLQLLREARARQGIATSSAANLFMSDGEHLVAVRFTFDFGCFPEGVDPRPHDYLGMWYTVGSDYGYHDGEWKMAEGGDSILLASEPLTSDTSRWLEVPEYSMLLAWREGDRLRVKAVDLDL